MSSQNQLRIKNYELPCCWHRLFRPVIRGIHIKSRYEKLLINWTGLERKAF